MKHKFLIPLVVSLIFVLLLVISNCTLESLFAQPSVSVTDITVTGEPAEDTVLNVTVKIKNNDWRGTSVSKTSYTAVIEGVTSSKMSYDLNSSISPGGTLTRQLPLTLPTDGAVFLLEKLTSEGSLDFTVTGKFTASVTCLGDLSLPLNVSGSTNVIIETANIFSQPDLTVDRYVVTSIPLLDPNVYLNIETTIENMDDHTADIKEVIYVADIEGVKSSEMTYSTSFQLTPNGTPGAITSLVMPLTLNKIKAATLLTQSTVDYTVTGTFFAETDLGSGLVGFYLPLDVSGTATLDNPF